MFPSSWVPHMTSLSRRAEAAEERATINRSIELQAEVIALKRKAAAWGANEDEESISELTGRWECLANWFPAAVVHGGFKCKSVEHAFQAAKAGGDADAAKAIRDAPTCKQAHDLGQKLPLPADWERRKRPLMLSLLRDKFRRDGALRERLLKTENKNLIATNGWGETYWGVSGGKVNTRKAAQASTRRRPRADAYVPASTRFSAHCHPLCRLPRC